MNACEKGIMEMPSIIMLEICHYSVCKKMEYQAEPFTLEPKEVQLASTWSIMY